MAQMMSKLFDLTDRVAVVTGGGGLLGFQHAAAIADLGGKIVLLDINEQALTSNAERLRAEVNADIFTVSADITRLGSVQSAYEDVSKKFGRVDILINNAARNPKVEDNANQAFSRLENFPTEQWDLDLAVGLGGAFNCCKVFGTQMARTNGGVILNIASDLGVIAPDQRLYRVEGRAGDAQPVKPVTYSVVKHGIIGLTKYLATYWADRGVRCNALSPGGVFAGQAESFVMNISRLIPMGRMAFPDEYRGAIAFLCSDASSYMNGANLIIDGGRTTW